MPRRHLSPEARAAMLEAFRSTQEYFNPQPKEIAMYQLFREIDPNSTPTEWMPIGNAKSLDSIYRLICEDRNTPAGYNHRHQVRDKNDVDVTNELWTAVE